MLCVPSTSQDMLCASHLFPIQMRGVDKRPQEKTPQPKLIDLQTEIGYLCLRA